MLRIGLTPRLDNVRGICLIGSARPDDVPAELLPKTFHATLASALRFGRVGAFSVSD